MVAHLTCAQCLPDRYDDYVRWYREQIMPFARSELGYRGMYLLVDRPSGSALTISLWDTRDDARAYEESSAYQARLIIVSEYLASPIVCTLYEVDTQV